MNERWPCAGRCLVSYPSFHENPACPCGLAFSLSKRLPRFAPVTRRLASARAIQTMVGGGALRGAGEREREREREGEGCADPRLAPPGGVEIGSSAPPPPPRNQRVEGGVALAPRRPPTGPCRVGTVISSVPFSPTLPVGFLSTVGSGSPESWEAAGRREGVPPDRPNPSCGNRGEGYVN